MTGKRIHEFWEAYLANILHADSGEGREAERRAFYFGAWTAMKHMQAAGKDFMEDAELTVDFSMGLFDPNYETDEPIEEED